jgi:hypothetical protein
MKNYLPLPKSILYFKEFKNYKEKIGLILPKRLDFSGNIKIREHFIKKKKVQIQQIKKLNKILKKNYSLFKLILLFYFIFAQNINENQENLNFFLILINKFYKIYNIISKLRRNLIEIKYNNKVLNSTSRRVPKVYKYDVDKEIVIFNPFYKFQYLGYPQIYQKFRKKLKKRLLVQRFRNKYKFVLLQQSLSLHTFLGTKEVSYANLVKTNNLNLLLFLYQYKIKLKSKTKTNYKEKKVIRRPFKVARMNEARFDILEMPDYALWYNKIEDQILTALRQEKNG